MLSQVCNTLRLIYFESSQNIWRIQKCNIHSYIYDRNNIFSSISRGLSNKCKNGQCWKCGVVVNSTIFCKHCNTLQKPDANKNYFDVIGIKHGYQVQDKELATKYRKLQNVLHPDRFSAKDKEEREISEQYSSLVNKAYSTLLQPLARGLYMLRLQGIHLEEDTKETDPAFLAKIMEINEELADAQQANEIKRLDIANRSTMEKLSRDAAYAFDLGDVNAAKQVLVKMKYFASIGARIKDLKQKMGLE